MSSYMSALRHFAAIMELARADANVVVVSQDFSAGPFWQLYEEVRMGTGIADLPETAGRYGIACGSREVEIELDRM